MGRLRPAGVTGDAAHDTVHRSPRFWDRPLVFDPGRLVPAASAGRAKLAYFPFGAGPRMCIGANLPSMEHR